MKKSLLALVIALALFLLIVLAGGVITIGDKLAAATPVLAWVFYGILLAVLVWLVVIPTCRIFLAKPFPKLSVDSAAEDTPCAIPSSILLSKAADISVDVSR